MYLARKEWDRKAEFLSWGSSTEVFSWDTFCEITIMLPPIPIQQKYVNIYNSILANQRNYERGLEDLKLVCDAYIENLRRKTPSKQIGDYIVPCDRRNDLGLTVDYVKGLTTAKTIIPTKADMNGVSLTNYKVVFPHQIAYVADTSRRGEKVSMGLNDTEDICLVSSISIVFDTKPEKLIPEYLMLFLTRSEFDRYARFNSWGSARETFDWNEMCEVKITIPDIKIQESIVNIYNSYISRKKINEKLKAQIKNICPILIKGSLEEAKKLEDNQ